MEIVKRFEPFELLNSFYGRLASFQPNQRTFNSDPKILLKGTLIPLLLALVFSCLITLSCFYFVHRPSSLFAFLSPSLSSAVYGDSADWNRFTVLRRMIPLFDHQGARVAYTKNWRKTDGPRLPASWVKKLLFIAGFEHGAETAIMLIARTGRFVVHFGLETQTPQLVSLATKNSGSKLKVLQSGRNQFSPLKLPQELHFLV